MKLGERRTGAVGLVVFLIPGAVDGDPACLRQTAELPMHRAIYREMPNVSAIVHTHSPFVTTLSVLRKSLPPVIDEMRMRFGGTIEVADYAASGTEELGRNAIRALGNRPAAILANHGNVCVAGDASTALQIAIFMEAGARVYVQALQIGEPSRIVE